MTAESPRGCTNPVSQQFFAPDLVGGTDGVLTVARRDGTLCRGLASPCSLAISGASGFYGADQPPREGMSFLHTPTLHFLFLSFFPQQFVPAVYIHVVSVVFMLLGVC